MLNKTNRLPAVKRILGAGDQSHIEPRRGTRQQARDYCIKDGDFVEWGQFERLNFQELFKQDIKFLKENYPAFYCRYHRGLFLLNNNIPKWRDVTVTIIWGKTGTGKTRKVMEMEDVYKLDPPYLWWDGYAGEKILLIDDYEKDAINRGMLLNICDGYKLRLQTKGGHCWAEWNKVFITSNFDPEGWASNALCRRVSVTENL